MSLEDAKEALDGGASVYVDGSIPNASVIQSKIESALNGRTDITLVVLPDEGVSAEDAVSELAPHTETGTVAVAYGLDSAVLSPAMGQEYARDLLDRADSINNSAHDALVTFIDLASPRLDEIAAQNEETVGVPAPSGADFPVVPVAIGGGVFIAAAVITALVARSVRRGRAPRTQWETNEDGDIIGLSAKKMTPALWLDLTRHLDRSKPSVLSPTQSAHWREIMDDFTEIAPRWRRMNEGGLANETLTIATEYLPRIISRYDNMPVDILRRKNKNGTTPSMALDKQLKLLSERVDELRVASFDKDVRGIEYDSEVVKARYTKLESEFEEL